MPMPLDQIAHMRDRWKANLARSCLCSRKDRNRLMVFKLELVRVVHSSKRDQVLWSHTVVHIRLRLVPIRRKRRLRRLLSASHIGHDVLQFPYLLVLAFLGTHVNIHCLQSLIDAFSAASMIATDRGQVLLERPQRECLRRFPGGQLHV